MPPNLFLCLTSSGGEVLVLGTVVTLVMYKFWKTSAELRFTAKVDFGLKKEKS